MIVAALDLGTNTFLCLVAETQSGKVVRVLEDHVKVVRLGQGLAKQNKSDKHFHQEALERAKKCLMEYKKIIEKYPVEKVFAAATSAARDVKNAEELFQIGNNLNIPISVISGEDEAKYSFYGAVTERDASDKIIVLDVGGGSTELIYEHKDIQGKSNIKGVSVDVGAVRLTELFVTKHPIEKPELEKMREYAQKIIKGLPNDETKNKKVVAVAGTPTNLAMLALKLEKFDETKLNDYKISLQELDGWVEKLAAMSVEERCHLPGLDPGRADVIVAGAIVLSETLKYLNKTELFVSTRGLRFGVAACL